MGIDTVMYVKLKSDLSNDEVRLLNNRIYEACDESFFWLDREEGRRPLSLNSGGDTLVVNTFSRYYGVGYERGKWTNISAVIRWLHYNVDGDLYYYGDCSSEEDVGPFGTDDLAELDEHWAKNGYPYFNPGHSKFTRFSPDATDRICGYCGSIYACFGVGGVRRFYKCNGCGQYAHLTGKGELIETGDEHPGNWSKAQIK